MDSVQLQTPDGIEARLASDEKVTLHDRRRILAAALVAAHLGLGEDQVRIKRDDPAGFGYHTQLFAYRDGDADEQHLPVQVVTAEWEPATIVAVSDPEVHAGFDIRPAEPDDETLALIESHFAAWPERDPRERLALWSQVHAVLAADGRGARVQPEHVQLDRPTHRGWVPDHRIRYDLVDLSRDGLLITLAYGRDPA